MRINSKKQNLSRLIATFTLFVSLAACGVGEAELDGISGSDAVSGVSADASSDSSFAPDHDSDAIESNGESDLDADSSAAPEGPDSGNEPDSGNRGNGIPSDCTRALAAERLCDGILDCEDATDERSCRGFICPTTVNWIPISQLCDGEQNCTDGGDEADEICATATTCTDGVGSFFAWDRCDLSEKCADGTDELNCDPWMCPDSLDLIVAEQLCDETRDCSNGADELVDVCFPLFGCVNGDEIPFSQRCDGTPDCLEGEDEAGCGRFVCDDDRTIPASNVCDGNVDCGDGSDEDTARCSYTFACADGITSVAGRQRCDGINDCPGSVEDARSDDEQECTTYVCADGRSIDYGRMCDEVRDCPNGDDELVVRCAPAFACVDSNVRIESDARCDGIEDCEDGSDEDDCT